MQIKRKLKIVSIIVGILAALLLFFIFGVVTVLIKNPFFARMTPVYWYNYVFLVLTALLSGAYIGLRHYNSNNQKNINSKCSYTAAGGAGGAVGGFFSFGCAICNKLLIWFLGLSGIIAYFMPIQPILGVISVILLGYAGYLQLKILLIFNNQTKTNFIHYNTK